MHNLKIYKDGHQTIEYCLECGKEGWFALSDAICEPISIICNDCGHEVISDQPCKYCHQFRENFKKAIDRTKLRN